MKAEKTPLRYIVQRIMRTIFTQDRREGFATDIYVGYKRQQPYFFNQRQARRSCNGERVIIAARRC